MRDLAIDQDHDTPWPVDDLAIGLVHERLLSVIEADGVQHTDDCRDRLRNALARKNVLPCAARRRGKGSLGPIAGAGCEERTDIVVQVR